MGKEQNEIDFAVICVELREILGFTQQKMADFLGVTLRTYQRYEASKGKPTAEAAFRLAELDICFRRSVFSQFITNNIKYIKKTEK